MTLGLVLAMVLVGCGGSSPPPSGDGGGGAGGGGGGGGHNWLAGARGTLASSSDGVTYQAATPQTSSDLLALYYVGRNVGWTAGADGTLMTTVDGGANWTLRSTGVSTTLRAVAFADPEVGIAAGDGATLLRSIDGGLGWTPAAASGLAAGTALSAVAIARDRSQAWAAGDGVLLHSTDGGNNFAAVGGLPAIRWRAIKLAADARHGVLVGDGGATWLTSDGTHWRAGATAPGDLRGVSITPDGARIVAVGVGGLVWRSLDGGATFARVSTGTAELRAIGFMDELPAQGWAVGVAGTISRAASALLPVRQAQGWAVGVAGTILHTSDGGATFQKLASPAVVDFNATEDFN